MPIGQKPVIILIAWSVYNFLEKVVVRLLSMFVARYFRGKGDLEVRVGCHLQEILNCNHGSDAGLLPKINSL